MNSDPEALRREDPGSSNQLAGWSIARLDAFLRREWNQSGNRLRFVLGTMVLIGLVFLVYRPILPGSLLMDDQRLIGRDNGLVNGEFTPRNIWFQTDFTLTTFAWWVQRSFWGENPAGYHAVNLGLQILSAVLLWRLLVRLKVPGAWLAAAVFAIHPVCVNSVARIAELKNTLSLPFYLLSFLGYLHYESLALYPADGNPVDQRLRRQATLWYAVSLIAYVLSLLSKTTAVMLPVVLLLTAAWQRRRITHADAVHTGPFFLLALAFGFMSMWFQKHQALAGLTLAPTSFGERFAAAGQDFWFYLGKALLPFNLSVVYLRWRVDPTTLVAYLPALLAAVVFLVCWRFRRRWGRHVLFGLGCFAVTLFPALGFFDAQFLTMWRVSDHLQYKPLIAAMALAVAGLASLPNRDVSRWTAVTLLLALSWLSFQRAQVFATEEGLFRDTLAKNPEAWMVHNDLGTILARRQDYAGAMDHFAASLRINPGNPGAHANLGHALSMQGKFDEAESHFRTSLKMKPDDPETHKNFAWALRQQGRNREALAHFRAALCFKPDLQTRLDSAALSYQIGEYDRAVADLRQALVLQPGQLEALNNLAWILATCPDEAVRNGTEAVRYAEQGCRQVAFRQTAIVSTLAAAYAEAGRFREATATAETAIKLANAAGETRYATVNRQLLVLYQEGKPWHEAPPAGASR